MVEYRRRVVLMFAGSHVAPCENHSVWRREPILTCSLSIPGPRFFESGWKQICPGRYLKDILEGKVSKHYNHLHRSTGITNNFPTPLHYPVVVPALEQRWFDCSLSFDLHLQVIFKTPTSAFSNCMTLLSSLIHSFCIFKQV